MVYYYNFRKGVKCQNFLMIREKIKNNVKNHAHQSNCNISAMWLVRQTVCKQAPMKTKPMPNLQHI